MTEVIRNLLRHDGVTPSAPAPAVAIDAVQARVAAALPDPLVELWRASDGVDLTSLDAHLAGPSEIMSRWFAGAVTGPLLDKGYVPLLDDHQSNYLAVVVHGPMAFRVVHVRHDDASRLLYRDLESCLRALLGAIDSARDDSPEREDDDGVGVTNADEFLHETAGDYGADAPRSPADRAAARALLAGPNTNGAWNDAVQLLDGGDLDAWAFLLETDHFVRRDARDRMRRMASPAVAALLRQDAAAFDAFAERVATEAARAGLAVGRRDGEVLRVGGNWMNLDAFFHRRSQPEAMPRIITWFQDVIARRDPRDRPGHCMA